MQNATPVHKPNVRRGRYRMTHAEYREWRTNAGDVRQRIIDKALGLADSARVFILTPSNRFVKCVRDPKAAPHFSGMGLQLGAPSPESCTCKAFAGTVPGEHHPVCQWNEKWRQSQGIRVVQAPDVSQQGVQHMSAPNGHVINPTAVVHRPVPNAALSSDVVHTPTGNAEHIDHSSRVVHSAPATIASAAPTVIAPNECFCADWARPENSDPNEHHPVCMHKPAWDASRAAGADIQLVLVDVDTGIVARLANSDEVEEWKRSRDAGEPAIVNVDGTAYLICTPGAAQQTLKAALELEAIEREAQSNEASP